VLLLQRPQRPLVLAVGGVELVLQAPAPRLERGDALDVCLGRSYRSDQRGDRLGVLLQVNKHGVIPIGHPEIKKIKLTFANPASKTAEAVTSVPGSIPPRSEATPAELVSRTSRWAVFGFGVPVGVPV
tara:strand:- start:980 stop:1363 length:384 start_codon:yes stop_codon:yes gene_type:complete